MSEVFGCITCQTKFRLQLTKDNFENYEKGTFDSHKIQVTNQTNESSFGIYAVGDAEFPFYHYILVLFFHHLLDVCLIRDFCFS